MDPAGPTKVRDQWGNITESLGPHRVATQRSELSNHNGILCGELTGWYPVWDPLGSVGGPLGIRMKGMGSITFSNGSGRPDGAPQDGIQYGIRWDPWEICWDPHEGHRTHCIFQWLRPA
jgi:hypothetical protein